MDIATLLGMGLTSVILFLSMVVDFHNFVFVLGTARYFIDLHAMLIVFGGTLGSLMIAYPIGKIMSLPEAVGRVFRQAPEQLIETLTLVIDVSKIARKNILAIEDALPSIDNLYLRNGLRLVVDRVDRELIIEILQSENRYLERRREEEVGMFRLAASLAPAFGLMGTLLGLILLLQNLSNPDTIGPAMGVAMTATFYGVILANVICTPWAAKLEAKKGDDKVLREMIRDGVLSIEKGERPDFIEQDLMNYLPPHLRRAYEDIKFEGARESGGA